MAKPNIVARLRGLISRKPARKKLSPAAARLQRASRLAGMAGTVNASTNQVRAALGKKPLPVKRKN